VRFVCVCVCVCVHVTYTHIMHTQMCVELSACVCVNALGLRMHLCVDMGVDKECPVISLVIIVCKQYGEQNCGLWLVQVIGMS